MDRFQHRIVDSVVQRRTLAAMVVSLVGQRYRRTDGNA